jgi:thiosulfate dehydrogenase
MRAALVLLLLVACDGVPEASRQPAAVPAASPATAAAVPAAAATPTDVAGKPTKAGEVLVGYEPPAEADIPTGPLGDSIRRGLDLFNHTPERLPAYATGQLSCGTCHLEGGRKDYAAKLAGVAARFPKYMERTGAVIPLQDRVNYCFTRSLAGNRLPTDSQEMVDIVNYLTFLSRGVPVGAKVDKTDLPTLPEMTGDVARGEALFTSKTCVTCHMADGQGVPNAFPPLWGPKSYSVGASMTRDERAASFIKLFMPKTTPGTLTDQEAYDLAAFINSHPRPDSPSKEKDWPTGGAPKDVPYATAGRTPVKAPPLLPRPTPERAVVVPPPPVAGGAP